MWKGKYLALEHKYKLLQSEYEAIRAHVSESAHRPAMR